MFFIVPVFVFVFLQRPLSATSPPAWLPYTAIDQLLHALSETQTHGNVSHFLFASQLFVYPLPCSSLTQEIFFLFFFFLASHQSSRQTGRVSQHGATDDRTPTRLSETSGSMRRVAATRIIYQFSICFLCVNLLIKFFSNISFTVVTLT